MVQKQSPEAQHQQTHELVLDYCKQISESENELNVCCCVFTCLAKTDRKLKNDSDKTQVSTAHFHLQFKH